MLLTGCASNKEFATLTGGACSAFPEPAYQIKGRTKTDQRWADETTEAGVAGCGWKRPAHRPVAMDAKPAVVPAVAIEPAPASKPAKRHWWNRIFHRKPPAEVQGG